MLKHVAIMTLLSLLGLPLMGISQCSASGCWLDADGDGYGDPDAPAEMCSAATATNQDDCDDTNSNIHPGVTDNSDGVDNDCDGFFDEDNDPAKDDDGDGYSENAGDCNDADPIIHPGATDYDCDNVDNDCDGVVDENRSDSYTLWWLHPENDPTVVVADYSPELDISSDDESPTIGGDFYIVDNGDGLLASRGSTRLFIQDGGLYFEGVLQNGETFRLYGGVVETTYEYMEVSAEFTLEGENVIEVNFVSYLDSISNVFFPNEPAPLAQSGKLYLGEDGGGNTSADFSLMSFIWGQYMVNKTNYSQNTWCDGNLCGQPSGLVHNGYDECILWNDGI